MIRPRDITSTWKGRNEKESMKEILSCLCFFKVVFETRKRVSFSSLWGISRDSERKTKYGLYEAKDTVEGNLDGSRRHEET